MNDETRLSIARINPPELGTPPGYSQVVEVNAGRMIFIAGQTALDGNSNLVGKGDFAKQAAQVFENLAIALMAAECTPANLVKLTVFLTDMGNLTTYREARNRFFASVAPPAAPAKAPRSTTGRLPRKAPISSSARRSSPSRPIATTSPSSATRIFIPPPRGPLPRRAPTISGPVAATSPPRTLR